MKYCFGVDIGGTTVKLGLFTTEGEIVDKWEIKTRTENQGEACLLYTSYTFVIKKYRVFFIFCFKSCLNRQTLELFDVYRPRHDRYMNLTAF